MTRTQVQLTDRQAERLRAIATAERVSIAELIRRAVEDMVRSGSPPPAERRRRAAEAAGRFASGRKETSRGHDEALAEAYAAR